MGDKPEHNRADTDSGQSAPDTRPKPTLLANISHELRTPMDSILGYVELLSETRLNDTQQGFLDAIQRSAQGLLDIMDDILNLSRLEAGKLVIHRQPFSIRDCIDSVTQMLAPSAYRKGLDFTRTVDHNVPVNFVGDPLRIRQILVNLIGNAIKFTPAGRVQLRASAHPFDGQRYQLVLTVSDTGIGIAEQDIPKLFEPFARPATPQHEISGTGLGLVISKALCEAMDGSIAVHSTPGEGSTFCVRVPLEAVEETFAAAESAGLLAGRRLVIASADPDFAAWLSECLQREGATTRIVSDLSELQRVISAEEYDDDAAVVYLRAQDLQNLRELSESWRPIRDRLPLLSLVNGGSGRNLREVMAALGGNALPTHVAESSVVNHVATLLQRSAGQSSTPAAVDADPVRQDLAGLRLLVADDNRFGREYLQMLLTRHGGIVETCGDGQTACEMILTNRYDLVLMDVRMPGFDGIEAVQSLSDWRGDPPIIGLTAAPEECCRALDSGMTDCLLKPIRPAVLLKYIVSHKNKLHPPPAQEQKLEFVDEEMLRELRTEWPQHVAELRDAVRHGSMAPALEAAHKINGIAALLGFEQLRATAASIEGLIRQNRLDGIDSLTRELTQEVDHALATLESR